MRTLLIFCLLSLFALSIPYAQAKSYPLGVEAFGGWDEPLVQDDVAGGAMFGVSVRGHIIAFLHGQLMFRSTSQGDKDVGVHPIGTASFNETLEGGTLTGFGANLILAGRDPASIWPYGFVGLFSNNFKPGNRDSENLFGHVWGGGVAFNLYNKLIYADVNTSLLIMSIESGNATRKNWQTMVGLMYMFQIPMK
jgi:hypothetical protein